MALFYADASALVKVVLDEPDSEALRRFIDDADLVASQLVLTEVPRAIRRASAHDPRLALETLMDRAEQLFDAVGLLPIDRSLLLVAGAFAEPALRALDAIHIAAGIDLSPVDGFITYDERQAAAARLAGLRTMAPGPTA